MILLALIVAAAAAAADPAAHDAAIEALVTDAYGAPPEFAADVLLRIAGSARVVDPVWKQELAAEAFLRAYAAVEPYRRTAGPLPVASRQAAQVEAYATGLNRVTLQIRAVQLMATLNPGRARELFEWMDVAPAAATCADPLVPAVDEYYNAVSTLARTFRRSRSDALQFLEYYLWRAHLPSEIPAVVLAVQRFRPSHDEAVQLEGFLDALLAQSSADARGFSSSNIEIVGRVADLQFFDRMREVPGWFLMDALRTYVLKQLANPRCSDSVTETLLPATFNGALRLLHVGDNEVKRIEGAVVAPSRMLPPAHIDLFWQDGTARQLRNEWLALRGSEQKPVPQSVRRTTEWRDVALSFLTSVDHWTERDVPNERDYLFEKASLYVDCAEFAPKGAVRTRAVQAALDFLRHQDGDRAARPMWFVFVRRLLDLSAREGRGQVLSAMEQSGHPVIALYARCERLVPTGARLTDRQP